MEFSLLRQLAGASRSYTGLTVLLVIVLALLVGGVLLVARSITDFVQDWRASKRQRPPDQKKAA